MRVLPIAILVMFFAVSVGAEQARNPFEAHRGSVYLGDESKLGKTVANRCDLQRVEGVWYCYDDKLGGIRPYCDALPHGTNPEVYCWEQESKEPVVRKDSRHISGEEKLYLRIDEMERRYLEIEKMQHEIERRVKELEESSIQVK